MLKQDVWTFNIGKGKHTKKVCVHLDLADTPSEEVIVNDIVRYIVAVEDICKTCA